MGIWSLFEKDSNDVQFSNLPLTYHSRVADEPYLF